jgi:hypothetical protein
MMNPQWEKQFMLSLLTLKTLELELQEEWNNARTNTQTTPALPVQAGGQSPDGSGTVRDNPDATTEREPGGQPVRNGTEY